jgi:hypothetical protein
LEKTREAGAKWWRRRHHGALEALLDLTNGPVAGVQMPWHVHAVATACGRSATESGCCSYSELQKMTETATFSTL